MELPPSNAEYDLRRAVQTWLAGFPASSPAVVIPIYNAVDDVRECIQSLIVATPATAPILALDDASPDAQMNEVLKSFAHLPQFFHARLPVNGGFVHTVNCGFAWCQPFDVIVINSDVVVPTGWLERMQAAANAQSNIGTVTPFTNYGTLLSLPERNIPVAEIANNLSLAEADARVQSASLKTRPVIPTAIGHLVYFKRAMLDTVGYFDEAFSPGYGEEVDLSQRAVVAGFCHVAADDVFVFHKGSRSFGAQSEARRRWQESHEAMLRARYPWYHDWVEATNRTTTSPLAFAIERAGRALQGQTIAIDATCLNGTTTGTQLGTVELIAALAQSPERFSRIVMVVNDGVPPAALCGLENVVDDVIPIGQLKHLSKPRFDLIHRPFQVTSEHDLKLLMATARQFIVSHLDCIAYSNPSYATNFDAWLNYRQQTERVFALADGITYLSQHGAADAVHKGLHVPSERACVTFFGADHQLHHAPLATVPAASSAFAESVYLLVLGTNFKHKNRAYAIRLFHELVAQFAWPGHLVLAGPHVSSGGSEVEEAAALAAMPALRDRVHDIGPISEAEKTWLLQHTQLVLYPSLYEGFGIVPFEAAAHGAPVLTFRATALSEVLGDEVRYLENHDPRAGAATAWQMLSDKELARQQVDRLQARARAFSWACVAERTWQFYRTVLALPSRQLISLDPTMSAELATDAVAAARHPALSWLRRIGLGARVLLTKGPTALRAEIRQYLHWRRLQF